MLRWNFSTSGVVLATRIDIVSGFLGAGKTTLINKLLVEIGDAERVAVVENEVGEIGIDGEVLGRSCVEVREVTNGCICCTLFGDFVSALRELLDNYELDRIIVEPTGIGQLSDVIRACSTVKQHYPLRFNILATVVDCSKWDAFSTTFGDFFRDQVGVAHVVFLSRVTGADPETIERVRQGVLRINPIARIVASPWESRSNGLVEIAEQGDADPTLWATNVGDGGVRGTTDFQTWCAATDSIYDVADLRRRLQALDSRGDYGNVVRGKGVVRTTDAKWILFDYLPGEINLRQVDHDGDGKIVIIGPSVRTSRLRQLFIEEVAA